MVEILITTLGLLIVLVLIWIGYNAYQLQRNKKVRDIRIKWINEDDCRYEKYSRDEMFDPSLKNWFGLKFPKEEDFE